MDQPDREAAAQFSFPVRQILSMVVVLGLVGLGAWVAAPRVAPVFLANPWLNGFIAFVFLIGVAACFWQLFQIAGSVRWIEDFVADLPGHGDIRPPRLLAPLATLLRARPGMMRIGSTSARSILDSVATRIDEARDITRYIVNLLIFLGLLGTFYGLATTVPALVETIRSLAPREGEAGIDVFNRLMSGLEAQLDGMGIAFASSLLGLAGSLVVGLLELFAGHGQNRFYRELEEWLSTITRLGFSPGEAEGEVAAGAPSGAILDMLTGQLDTLQALVAQTAEGRVQTDRRVARLVETVEALATRDPAEGLAPALQRLADGQARLIEVIEAQGAGPGLDAESRMHLRSVDAAVLRLLEETAESRQEMIADLRGELAQLIQVIRAAAPPQRPERSSTIAGQRS